MNPFHKSDNQQLQLFAARIFFNKFKLKTKQQQKIYSIALDFKFILLSFVIAANLL